MSVERSEFDVELSAPAPRGAVFLSYASQDAEAAKRICEALRAAGVEVWFDQNELVGGDAWDAKIRKQIADCALFVPIVSASTQARREGYFRLEWKLAAQRTHMIADGTPFLLPVVIDETRDADALVPAEFRSVQWTRLRQGFGGRAGADLAEGVTEPGKQDAALTAFCSRVVKLLVPSEQVAQVATSRRAGPLPTRPARSKAAWIGFGWAAVGIVFALVYVLRPLWKEPRTTSENSAHSAPAQSEAQRLVAKAREILDQGDEMNRENYALAEELLKRAEAADVTEASAWALHAWMSADLYRYGLDRNEPRLAQIQAQASRAMSLAPESLDAQLALLRSQTATRTAPEDIAKRQIELAEKHPDDPRVYRLYGLSHAKDSITFKMLERGLARWPDDPRLQGDMLNSLLLGGRYAEASEFAERVTRGKTGARVLAAHVFIQLWWHGDPAAASASVARWPAWFLSEDRGAGMATVAALVNRQPDHALDILRRFPRDYIRDSFFTGPRSALTAWAHEAAGQAETAEAEWRVVAQVCDRELAANPTDAAALHWKAWALARLGDKASARQTFRVLLQRRVSIEGLAQVAGGLAGLALVLDDPEEALRELGRLGSYDPARTRPPSRALFDVNPLFEPLRRDARFQALRNAAIAPAANDKSKSASPLSAVADDKSVAVLAFANLSSDKEQEYFSDGISEELLNVLAKVPGLKVSARTSAFFFKGKNTPIPEIAKQLGVAYVVEGSVRKAGDKVRITAQLIKAADGFHVWSETFTRDLKDVFAVQDEIAGLIAGNLSLRLAASSNAARASVDPGAYDQFLKARQMFNQMTNGPTVRALGLEAVRLLEDAVRISPEFAPAHGLLARVQANILFNNLFSPKEEERLRARAAAALDAVERLAPGSFDARIARGYFRYYADFDLDAALDEFYAARRLEPNNNEVQEAIALVTRRKGRWAEAAEAFERVLERDPLNLTAYTYGADILSLVGRGRDADALYSRALRVFPGNFELELAQARNARVNLGDEHATDRLLANVMARPDPEGEIFRARFSWLRDSGRMAEAEALLNDSAQVARLEREGIVAVGEIEIQHGIVARRQGRIGDAGASGRAIMRQVEAKGSSVPERSRLFVLSYAHALLGEIDAAQRAADAFAAAGRADVDAIHALEADRLRMQLFVLAGQNSAALDFMEAVMARSREIRIRVLMPHSVFHALQAEPRFQALLRRDRAPQ